MAVNVLPLDRYLRGVVPVGGAEGLARGGLRGAGGRRAVVHARDAAPRRGLRPATPTSASQMYGGVRARSGTRDEPRGRGDGGPGADLARPDRSRRTTSRRPAAARRRSTMRGRSARQVPYLVSVRRPLRLHLAAPRVADARPQRSGSGACSTSQACATRRSCATRRDAQARCGIAVRTAGGPDRVQLGQAHRTRPVPGRDRGLLVGEEHPVRDVTAASDGAQPSGAVESSVQLPAPVPAELPGHRTLVASAVGAGQQVHRGPRVTARRAAPGRGCAAVRTGFC